MADGVSGSAELRDLAVRLRDAGSEGRGLKRDLYAAMDEAVRPVADEVGRVSHLMPYLPDPYAEVLASDMTVRTARTLYAGTPRIEVTAKGRLRRRRLKTLDEGSLSHPLFGNRERWFSQPVRPGFFSDPVNRAAPQIRDRIAAAMAATSRRITGR